MGNKNIFLGVTKVDGSILRNSKYKIDTQKAKQNMAYASDVGRQILRRGREGCVSPGTRLLSIFDVTTSIAFYYKL